VLDFNKDKCKLHPTQKPVALLEYFIKTYTSEIAKERISNEIK